MTGYGLFAPPRIGPVSFRQLIARFGTAGEALRAIPDMAARGGGRASVADAALVEREIAASRACGARYLMMGDADYPVLLDQMEGAPPALIVRGDAAFSARPCVAIVGARNASAAACRFARMLAQDLGQRGAVVVSGLARGIDTEAHRGSIDSGTIGVIASGIDVSFPPENKALQEEVAQRGLLVTEHPPGTQPLARHFPARNRIIAGLALGTVVVEAAPKSGSLITARLAGEAGREVMAVPGSPLDPRAQGCNLLMQASTVARFSQFDGKSRISATFNDLNGALRPLPFSGTPPKSRMNRHQPAPPFRSSWSRTNPRLLVVPLRRAVPPQNARFSQSS